MMPSWQLRPRSFLLRPVPSGSQICKRRQTNNQTKSWFYLVFQSRVLWFYLVFHSRVSWFYFTHVFHGSIRYFIRHFVSLLHSRDVVEWLSSLRNVREGYARGRVPRQRVLHTFLQTLRVCQERLHPRRKQKRESSQEVKYVLVTYSKSALWGGK